MPVDLHTPLPWLRHFIRRVIPSIIAATTGFAGVPQVHLEPGLEVSWPTVSGNTYQLQSRASDNAAWTDIGGVVAGDDKAHVTYIAGRDPARRFQVLETYPVVVEAPTVLENGSFENGDGGEATGWDTLASQPPVRITGDAHTGTASMHGALLNVGSAPAEGMLQQTVLPAGSTLTVGEPYVLSFWAKQVSAGPSYVQQYRLQWLSETGASLGGTGLQTFGGTIGQWTKVTSPSQVAPAGTAGVKIVFRLVTGAVSGGLGEVMIDDVAVAPVDGTTTVPGSATRSIAAATGPAGQLSWLSATGVRYSPEKATDLRHWTAFSAAVTGDGNPRSVAVPLAVPSEYFRLALSDIVVAAPTNVRALPSTQANAIGVAWDANPNPGVTGYRVLYGIDGGSLDRSIDVGTVTSATISGLVQGTTYRFTVATLAAGVASPPAVGTFTAQPGAGGGIDPLFSAATVLEPATSVETSTALITTFADRARDRHAREAVFNSYDHYLTFYWEQRVANIEIIDEVAKGGSQVIFNYTTQAKLNPAEFRAFYRGITTPAEYHHNVIATFVSNHPSLRYPGETDYNYTITLKTKLPENRPLQLGDGVELEISQFLESVRNGRLNYYGTTFLYVIGQGVVPWYQESEYLAGGSTDSRPLPEIAWLGGRTTLPYQYSNEPEHRFKQTAGNIAPASGQPFMLGRRLHHTEFDTGLHTEPGNPAFTDHAGKLGPKFVAKSCVECHLNNGRSLPPAVGSDLSLSVVKVSADGLGAPHPTYGEELQPQSINGSGEGSATLAGYTMTNGSYGDGTAYSLRRPNYTFSGEAPAFYSVRVAPPLIGLGLLEAVAETTIEALADPADVNGDGISGRLQLVPDPEDSSKTRLGRFTHKAAKATVSHQIAHALNRDMGVTTAVFPVLDGETTAGAPKLGATELAQMTRYVSVLGVSARRDLTDPIALRGEQVFQAAGCAKCHAPTLTTSDHHPVAELRGQTIHPFTDLLLHDMGSGLADNFGEESASGAEWRTTPLWNIGLTAGVSGDEAYLHDGRARTLEEAILWHGGESEAAKEVFRTSTAADRTALIKFLQSL